MKNGKRLSLLFAATVSIASIVLAGCGKSEDDTTKNQTPEQQKQRAEKQGD